jgi:hypothetical protein
MFKSIHQLKYLEYNPKTVLYSYLYKIIDDDFEEEIVGFGRAGGVGRSDVSAVIDCYSKRNLNIPKNLLLFFMFHEKQFGYEYHSVQQQIFWCMQYQELFPKYKEDVDKYLTLV